MVSSMFFFLSYIISVSVLGRSSPVSGMIVGISGSGGFVGVLFVMACLQLSM